MMTSEVEINALVAAVDRLNCWARSHSGRAASGMIYYMKTEILRRSDLPMEHRGIVVAVKCRDCGGSGKYSNGRESFDHCRACYNSGRAQLQFVETMIEPNIRWHTPRFKFPKVYDEGFTLTFDWCPNQPGMELEPWVAARLLNLAEPCFARPGPRWTSYGEEYDIFKYSLNVGKVAEACEFCGCKEKWRHYHLQRRGIEWGTSACGSCAEKYAKGKDFGQRSIFDAFAFPISLTAHPEIQRWMDRHA